MGKRKRRNTKESERGKEEKGPRIKREAANYVAFTTISLSPPTIKSRFRLWAAIGKKKIDLAQR
jgi:hypothetical protein